MIIEKEFYKEIVESLPEGVAICDSEQVIIDVNKNFRKISGFSKEELVGRSILEIISLSNEAKETCKVCSEQDREHPAYQVGELKNKDDKLTCIRINYSITAENNIIYLIIPFSNIAFLNQAHIDFVSTVSHELRTPLTSIKGFADTLLSAGDDLSKEQQIRFISIIKSQIDRLARLVENLLTVSKLEARSSKSIYMAIEVDKAVESVLYNLQHKAKEHKIEVEPHPDLPLVWVDADKFEQVLMNLVDNAIKYSKPGTVINIDAKFIENKIEIKVKDNGFGIPEEFLSKIFTRFARIDNPLTRQAQGTGLGLYITKSLVNSMKGEIKAESSEAGSVFTITLPVVSPETHTQQKFQEGN